MKIEKKKSNNTPLKLESIDVEFNCASCNSKFILKSTLSEKNQSLDICSNCHPFYVGDGTGQQIRGRAEQFNKKIAKIDPLKSKDVKKTTKPKDNNKKIVKSLNSL